MSNGLQPPDTPPVLYKYREFGNKHHWKTIADGEFYCAPAEHFNDPFDLNPVIHLPADEEVLERLARKVHGIRRTYWDVMSSREKSKKMAYAKVIIKQSRSGIEDVKRVIERGLGVGPKKLFGVLSLSGERDQPLMWAHYACNHTGFCVGIDTSVLEDVQQSALDSSNSVILDLMRVNYESDRHPMSASLAMQPETQKGRDEWKKAITQKSKDWKYEKEWRLASYENPEYKVKLGCEGISEIILGCRISEENKEKVFDLVCTEYTSPPDLFQAELDDQEYRLNIEPISLP